MRAGTRAGRSSRSREPRTWPPALPGRCCSAGRRAGWPRPQVRARCRSRPRSAGRGAVDRCSALCGGGPARGLVAEARKERREDRGLDRGERRDDRDDFPDRVDDLTGVDQRRWRWRRRWRRRGRGRGRGGIVSSDRLFARRIGLYRLLCRRLLADAAAAFGRLVVVRPRLSPQECSRLVSSDRCRCPSQAHSDHPLRAASRRRVHSHRPARRTLASLRSPPRRTIDPPGPRASNWFPFVAASAQGTSAAASRSTDAGSGRERPLAAKSGIGSSTPTKTSKRSQRRRHWAVRKVEVSSSRSHAARRRAVLQAKRRLPRLTTYPGRVIQSV